MKNLITLLLVIITSLGYSQNSDYVKSSSEANVILFNKFKDHRENHGYYGKTLINTEASDILLPKVLWQSRGHFLSHGDDPNHSWRKADNHSIELANTNSDTVWKAGCTNYEISTMIPIILKGGDTTTHKDSLQNYINSEQFMEEAFQGFHNSPPHNAVVLNSINSDLNYTSRGQYVNYGIKTYFTIAGGVDLKNKLWKPEYNSHTYYVVITCVISWVRCPIEYVYPVSYPMNDLGKDYVYTQYSSSLKSRVNEKGKIELYSPYEWDGWKRISKNKLSTYSDSTF
jgi:hypothetical protein